MFIDKMTIMDAFVRGLASMAAIVMPRLKAEKMALSTLQAAQLHIRLQLCDLGVDFALEIIQRRCVFSETLSVCRHPVLHGVRSLKDQVLEVRAEQVEPILVWHLRALMVMFPHRHEISQHPLLVERLPRDSKSGQEESNEVLVRGHRQVAVEVL